VADHAGAGHARQQPRGHQPRGQRLGRQRLGAPRRTRLFLPAAVTGTALLIAACGGPAAATGSSTYQAAFRKELAYAQCMRTHGVPGFPDPNSNGIFDTTVANRNDFHGPAYASANKKCEHLQGSPPTTAQVQRSVTEALKYAACMRAHGVANFSAGVNGDQVRMGFQGGAAAANSTRALIAQRICRPLLPRFLAGS
jgi:hypothetical protein